MSNRSNEILKKIDSIINANSANRFHEIEKEMVVFGIRKYLYQAIVNSDYLPLWVIYLDEKEYFNLDALNILDYDPKRTTEIKWDIIECLTNTLKTIAKISDCHEYLKIIDIVNRLIENECEKTDDEKFNYPNIVVKLITNLPIKEISECHIRYIKFALGKVSLQVSSIIHTDFLPKLVESRNRAILVKLLPILLGYKTIVNTYSSSSNKYESLYDGHFLKKLSEEYNEKIYTIIEALTFSMPIKILNEIVRSDKESFNEYQIRTIENHPQSVFTDEYEYRIVYFIRDSLLLLKIDDLKTAVKHLFRRKHPIFTRLALNTVRERYKNIGYLFWDWTQKQKNPFDIKYIHIKHELWLMLKENAIGFTDTQIDQIITWIESKDFSYYNTGDYSGEEIACSIAYRKKEWLLTLRDIKNPVVDELWNKYTSINSDEVRHPSFDFYLEGMERAKTETSPEDFNKMSNREIVDFLSCFSGPDRHARDGDSVYDLQHIFEITVKDRPERFIHDLDSFKSIDLVYISSILGGLKDAWRSKKAIDWEKLFKFIEQIILSDNFRHYIVKEDSFNYKNWVIDAIADLIGEGVNNEETAFDPSLMERAEYILLTLSEIAVTPATQTNDVITYTLNSSKGRIYTTLIKYSLRYSRLNKQDNKHRWKSTIKTFFEDRVINNPESSPEIWVTVGQYLTNLLYLDSGWVIDNINHLFPKERDEHWKSVFNAYIFFSRTIYQDLYKTLKDNGHYTKALYTSFESVALNEDLNKPLMNHIGIAYLSGIEKLDDQESAISILIEKEDPEQYQRLVEYFWRIGSDITDEKRNLVRLIWSELYPHLKRQKMNPKYHKALSTLTMLVSLFKDIDDEMLEWLKLSSIFTPEQYQLYHLIDYLEKIVEHSPSQVGKLYLFMLDCNITFREFHDDVYNTIRKIYETGLVDIGNEICDKFVENGDFSTRDLFEEFNQDMQ